MIYVLDACALISYLHNETGTDIAFDLLKKEADGECTAYINIINLIEVHYANIRSLGAEQAAAILEKILSIPIQIVSDISSTFVTADHQELEVFANKETLNFLWFR